jgi:outer membrane biosynthesis protein TonB
LKAFAFSLVLHVISGFLLFEMIEVIRDKFGDRRPFTRVQLYSKLPGKIAGRAAGTANSQARAPASTKSQKLASVTAKFPKPPQPEIALEVDYPKMSRILGEQGDVLFEVKSGNYKLIRSSGFSRLDKAAEKGMKEFSVHQPPTDPNVKKQVRFVFNLKGNE